MVLKVAQTRPYPRWDRSSGLLMGSRVLPFYSKDQGVRSIHGWLKVWWPFLLASESFGLMGPPAALAGLELPVFLSLPLECWD